MADIVESSDYVEGGEGDMWGDLEVQENIIPQLLEGTTQADQSARKVRFTANSTLAVYPSEKSLSGEEGSGDEYDEEYDEEDEDEEDEDEEDDEDDDDDENGEGNGGSGDEEEGAFSDDDDEVVINEFKDSRSFDLPFIHIDSPLTTGASDPTTSSSSSTLFTSTTSTVPPSVQHSTNTPTTTTTTTTTTNVTSQTAPTSTLGSDQRKEPLQVHTTEPSHQDPPPAGSPSQRRWYQQKQTYQRYTPRYSPKSSPTEGPTTNTNTVGEPTASHPQPSTPHTTLSQSQSQSQKPELVQQLERAKLELNREIARAKEASDNLTISSLKLQESVSSLSESIATSRQLLSALG